MKWKSGDAYQWDSVKSLLSFCLFALTVIWTPLGQIQLAG